MDQTLLVRFVLCYLMIAAIVARPLPSDKEKRQSGIRQMEDVQLSESELQRNGEELPNDQGGVRFYSSSSGINLWSDGEIPYIFDKDFESDYRKKARKAMEEWSAHTCIKFRRIKSSEIESTNILDFVRIQLGNVTNSRVGRKDRDWKTKGQELNIKREQAKQSRIYLHEFGHVIGLHHEHSRKDRDRYVKIYSENIVPGVGHNFDKINHYEKNTPYDYYSIMHYAIHDYAVDKSKITIEILNPDSVDINIDSIGERRKLSSQDIAWVNKLYNCEVTPEPPVIEPPPKFYKHFKVKLVRVPKTVPKSGYIFTAKEYLKCNNESCHVQSNQEVELFITKLNSSTGGLQIGDEVLLSSRKSGVRQGEWILCDLFNCYSSQTCLNSSYNSSSGQVNFAFNRLDCKEHVLKIKSKFQKSGTIENSSRIVLEYSDNPRSQQEWMHCEPGGSCSRKECKRTNVTILGLNTTCDDQMDEFEAIFV